MNKLLSKILFFIRHSILGRNKKKIQAHQEKTDTLPKVDGVKIDFKTGTITLKIAMDKEKNK